MNLTKKKLGARKYLPVIHELLDLGLLGEILSIRTTGKKGTLIPDLTVGLGKARRVKTGDWDIADTRTFDYVVLRVERPDSYHDVYTGQFVRLHRSERSGGQIVEMSNPRLAGMTKSISKVFNGGKVSGRGTAYVSISPGLSKTVIFPTRVYKEGRESNATYSSDQSPFSQDVRKNCFDRCVVTGVQSRWRTEAAHITPRHEEGIPDVTNGLLLRRDIHNLFDHNHCAIDPDNMKVYFSPQVCAMDEDLLEWQGSTIIASRMQTHINIEYLRPRWGKFIEIHGKMME